MELQACLNPDRASICLIPRGVYMIMALTIFRPFDVYPHNAALTVDSQ
jgi:hypothetical protein